MSVIVEFTIQGNAFSFGRVVQAVAGMDVTLERIVPTERLYIPYFWASGGDFKEFERKARQENAIKTISSLDRVNDSTLYRVEWSEREQSLITGIQETNGAILEAFSNGKWHFRLRFPNHDRLTDFYNYCTQHDVKVHIDRVYTLEEASQTGRILDLTPEQREALILALRRGYFTSPKEVTLTELAKELGISKQALSQRLRRGNEQVLREVLLSQGAE